MARNIAIYRGRIVEPQGLRPATSVGGDNTHISVLFNGSKETIGDIGDYTNVT